MCSGQPFAASGWITEEWRVNVRGIMATTLWKGTIRFGGIDVPVKLHTAVREERAAFHLLHDRDQARLRQQMICTLEKLAVPGEEQVRGFEVEKGKYVIVDPEELEQAAPAASRKIEVHEFVKTAEIDPFLLARVYTLKPDSEENGYNAVVKALNTLDLSAVCTWSMRKRSYLGVLQASGNLLRLVTLRSADELVPVNSLELHDVPVSDKELAVGTALIEQLTAPFDPEKFRNEHQQRLQDMIAKKARGEKIPAATPRRLKPTESDRLLRALEASLKKAA